MFFQRKGSQIKERMLNDRKNRNRKVYVLSK